MARVTKPRLVITLFCAVAFIVGVFLCILHQPALYHVTVLPSLAGGRVHAHALNDLGLVVGVENVGGSERLFLWDRKNGIQDLGPATGDQLAIDDSDRIAGTMPDPNGRLAFLWESGKGRTRLGTLGGSQSIVTAMNNRGQVVGVSHDANNASHAFIWSMSSGMRRLAARDGSRGWPQCINDAAHILMTKPSGWFLMDSNGTMLLDAVLPNVAPRNVNNSSCLAGVEGPGGAMPRLIFWSRQGTPRYVASLSAHAALTRLNDKGQIAYTNFCDRDRRQEQMENIRGPASMPFEGISFLWDPIRGGVSLTRYLRGMRRFIVEDLNNNGAIVGTGETEDGTIRAVLLEPIPERWHK